MRREYLRSLVNTGQVVINRAFLYNNPAIYQDYAKADRHREEFKKLIDQRIVIPYLLSEESPATRPIFTRRDAGWEGWSQVIQEVAPACLRLSWESDKENATQVKRLLSRRSNEFLKNLDELDPDLLTADFRLPPDETAAFVGRLRQVTTWAHRRASEGKPLNREDVYKEFVVLDGTDPGDRQYDPAKSFSSQIKQLVDLRYNANLADALGSYMLSPEDSLRRRALQEWLAQQERGRADGDYLAHTLATLRFDQITDVLGALGAFENLTLGGVLDLRATRAWRRYHSVLQAFLSDRTLETFGNADHGAEAVALAYREVIKEAGPIAASYSSAAIQERWDPIVEIMIEFAGAIISIFFNPAGDGNNAFRVTRDLMPGVSTRAAKAVFHLVIGRSTRSRGRSRIENSMRVLDTKLEHGRRDWENFPARAHGAGFPGNRPNPQPTGVRGSHGEKRRRMTDPDTALTAYNEYRQKNPQLFINPPDTAFEIVFDDQLQRRVGAGIMYQDGYSILLRDAVRFLDGSVGAYTRVVPAAGQGGAAVLPLVGGKIVLIRHERHSTRVKHWEIPRGFANHGERPAETAQREIMEELGVPSPELFDIGSIHPDTGGSSGSTRLYLALLPGVGQIERNEGIDELIMVGPEDFDTMVRDEQITDSFTLAAVLQARIRGLIG